MSKPKVVSEVRQVVPLPPMEAVEVQYQTEAAGCQADPVRTVLVKRATGPQGDEGVEVTVYRTSSGNDCHQLLDRTKPSKISVSRNCAEAMVLALARFYELPYTPPDGLELRADAAEGFPCQKGCGSAGGSRGGMTSARSASWDCTCQAPAEKPGTGR